FSVGLEYPLMIGTDQALGMTAGVEANPGSAVRANIKKRPQALIASPDNDEGFVSHFIGEVIPSPRNFAHMPGIQPVAHENKAHVRREDFRTEIEGLFEGKAGAA